MRRLLVLPAVLSVSGCAALAEAVRGVADFTVGTPPPDPSIVTEAVKWIPEPWNYVATALGGSLIGVWGWLYRRRLLKADPTKVE